MYFGESIKEVLESIRRNKVRSFLAGFGVFWGIMIFTILLGVGQGFSQGVLDEFKIFAQKSIYVYGGQASENGVKVNKGDPILFNMDCLNSLHNHYFTKINQLSPIINNDAVLSINGESYKYNITGIDASYFYINNIPVADGGRLFNNVDVENLCNVIVIGDNVGKTLFHRQVAAGKEIDIDGVIYKITGVLESNSLMSLKEMNSIYMPYTTMMAHNPLKKDFSSLCITLRGDCDVMKFEKDLKGFLCYKLGFSTFDENAIYIANIEEQTKAFEKLFSGLELFIWVIGLCLLVSGVVGVCNIMLIIVKERTNEIGLRISVGALPKSIISLILMESFAITFIFGVLGILFGVGLLKIMDTVLSSIWDSEIISQTIITPSSLIVAIVILIFSGLIAGLYPALKAAIIEPVEAIRYENRE